MANAAPFSPREVQDAVFSFESGVDMGKAAILLPKNTLASGTNITLRGDLATPRPAFRKIDIDFGYPDASSSDFQTGKFQGGGYYKPDNGFESLMFQINGRLFQITPGTTTASFIDRTIPGDPNPIQPDQAWLWQSEEWMIDNDGQSVPIFFTQTPVSPDSFTRRSTWNTQIARNSTNSTAATVPAVGSASGALNINGGDIAFLQQNIQVTITNLGTFLVQDPTAGAVILVNLTATAGKKFPIGNVVNWYTTSTELPPGRMGAYGLGQNWICLTDGKQFMAGDQVGSSSGTVQYNFRNAVLNNVQNTYLAGGGNFTVPGSAGDIRAMAFSAILDASLGQGPLGVFTPNTVFSCQVPTDRTQWQNLTNPILPESVITNGALGQWSTVVANSDFIYRAIDGIRSYALTRRDFNTWGQTPISMEVDPIISRDDPSLLQFASAVVFDNRMLMTTDPTFVEGRGVYWKQLVALNFDPVSSLRGKAPSIYDGTWTGLNVFQLITGQFSGTQRAFALCYNAITGLNELHEILKSIQGNENQNKPLLFNQSYFDNDNIRITSAFQTAVLFRETQGKSQYDLVRLLNGEMYIDDVRGTTDVQVWYKPDSAPCWVPWTKFSICAPMAQDDPSTKPGYRTRIGFGQPDITPCEPSNNRPYCIAHWFQLRFVFTGPYRFLGARLLASVEAQPQYAPPAGCCENDVVIPMPAGAIITEVV